MEPVRVKYYGLMSLTRRQYLTMQAVLLTLALVIMTTLLLASVPDALRKEAATDFWIRLAVFILDNILWLGLLVLVLEAIETWLMLRKFAQKEAEQQAGSPGKETAASPHQNPS